MSKLHSVTITRYKQFSNQSPTTSKNTIEILKIQTLEKNAVIILNLEQCGFTTEQCVLNM